MKCYNTIPITPLPEPLEDVAASIDVPAKMLGSSITDGRYNGVNDGSAGLLVGQYDNDSSLSVDPLCDLSTDTFGMRSGPSVKVNPHADQAE